jgi:hypothetical protein
MTPLVSRWSSWLAVAALSYFVAAWCGHAPAQGQGKDKVVPATNFERSELDAPLALLHEARRNYTAVKDYTCHLVSQERVRGKLEEKSIIEFKMKTDPFSVYMRWLAPKNSVGQEVAFVAGKNNNKMRVKSNTIGKGKLLGWMSIDTNDPRVLEHSRHTIVEAGIGNMIEQYIRHWELARQVGKSKVQMSEATYNGRKCVSIEVTATEKTPQHYCYRSVLYLEEKSKLPIRLENYDWPREGGERGGDLLEMFSYIDLRFNVGLGNEEFNK